MSLALFPSSIRIITLSTLLTFFGITSVESAAPGGVSGLITGMTGTPTARGTADGAARPLSLGDTVSLAEELRTLLDDSVEVLWDRRAVILVQPQSSAVIREPQPGDTHVDLSGGSVRVTLAYGSRPNDLVTVHTPTSRIFTRGGIVEVDVIPSSPSFLSRVGAAFSRTEGPLLSAPLEAVRVLEGQSGIEPLQSPGSSRTLEAGTQARIAAGTVKEMSNLPPAQGGLGLASTDRRQGTPRALAQSIARVHVSHALEVERLMTESPPSLDQIGKAPVADVKGAIVATSLGVPTTSFTSAGASSAAVPVGGQPSVATPLPTLPPIQVPTITSLAPGQSGGNNSRNILNQILGDDNRGRGRGRD